MHPFLTSVGDRLRRLSARSRIILALTGISGLVLISIGFLRAQTQPPAPAPVASALLDGRPCSSKATIFEDLTSPDALSETFRQQMALVVDERTAIVGDPERWTCGADEPEEPPLPALTAMATALPGWRRRDRALGGGFLLVPKPVTMATFSSVTGEFLRAYECRILELQAASLPITQVNGDLDATAYCCQAGACVPAGPSTRCDAPPSPDRTCGGACPVILGSPDIVARPSAYVDRLHDERTRARVAMERLMLNLASYDRAWRTSRDLSCLMRASLDLQAEMSLLATATSCLPRLWDAVTSLHDRTSFTPPPAP